MLKVSFVLFLAVALVNTAVFAASTCAMSKKCCCHETIKTADTSKIKADCCKMTEAPVSATTFLKSEAVSFETQVLVFSSPQITLQFQSVPLVAMVHLQPLPEWPHNTVLRI